MSWEELLDITPGMFLALNQQRQDHERNMFRPFQFIATVVARCAGNPDADFMEEPETRKGTPEMFEAWLIAKSQNGQVK